MNTQEVDQATLKELEAVMETSKQDLENMKERLMREVDDEAAKALKEEIKVQKKACKESESDYKKALKAIERERRAEEKRIAREQQKLAKQEEREANRMPEENGVRVPKPGTKTRRVWDLADALSNQLNAPTPVKPLLEACAEEGINDSTTKTQYARWRKFHNVSGRITAPQADEATPAN